MVIIENQGYTMNDINTLQPGVQWRKSDIIETASSPHILNKCPSLKYPFLVRNLLNYLNVPQIYACL